MKRTILLLAISVLIAQLAHSQNYKFGKVSKSEVELATYKEDTLADAVILHRNRETYFNYEHPEGWILVTEVHERIKVLTKDGLDYGTKKLRLYNSGGNKERVKAIKGYTYNLEGGKMKSQKLKSSGIFENKINENNKEVSITMPNVKEGSVIELKYSLISPYWKIEDLVVQRDIPVAHYKAIVRTPGYFRYRRMVKGNLAINPKEYVKKRNLTVSFEQSVNKSLTQPTQTSNIMIEESVSEYEFRYVPALKEELYVDNIDNYRFEINYELASTQFPDGTSKQYSTSWEEVARSIYKSKYFGSQIDKKGYLKSDAAQIEANNQGALQKMMASFNTIKNRMNWNGRFEKYSENVQKAYNEKTGTVADINLMLLGLLKQVGVNAYPVLVSTRNNGIPIFPTREGFNYVIVSVEINDQRYLLDATDKMSVPNVLPTRALNWYGTLVQENGNSKQIKLYPEVMSSKSTLLNVEITEDGDIIGSKKENFTLLEALEFRTNNKGVPASEKIESLINQFDLTAAEQYSKENFDDLDQPVKDSFEFEKENAVEIIGDDLYFSPLFFLAMAENPFKSEQRNFPVDYKYPFQHRKIINIRVPEGYKVSSLPEAVMLSLPEQMGTFKYNIAENNGTLNVQSSFKMNNSVVPAFQYRDLKEFYIKRIAKETEKVVLTKL